MKSVLFSTVLVTLATASAQDMSVPVKTLSAPIVVASQECSEETYQKCAVDLCGPPGTVVLNSIDNKNLDAWVAPGVMEKFPALVPNIRAKAEQKIKLQKEKVAAFEKGLADPSQFFDFTRWSDFDYSRFNPLFDKYVTIEIDTNKPLAERVKIKKASGDHTSIFTAGADEYISTKIKNFSDYAPNGIRDGFYKISEAKDLCRTMWDSIKVELEANKSKLDPAVAKQFDEVKGKFINLTSDNFSLSSLYTDLLFLRYSVDKVLNRDRPYPVSPSTCPEKCKAAVQEYVKAINVSATLEDLKNNLPKESAVDEVVNKCKASLAAAGLKDSDARALKKLLPEVKSKILSRGLAGFSAHSKAVFKTYFDTQLNLSFKKSGKKEKVDDFVEKWSRAPFISTYTPDAKSTFITAVTNSLADSSSELEDDECEPADIIWDGFSQKGEGDDEESGDDFDPNRDNIQVSAFSCSYEQLGKQVLAHEIGHALSWLVRNKKLSGLSAKSYLAQRKCVRNNVVNENTKSKMDDFGHPGDLLTTEEDMADIISYRSFIDEPGLYECSMLDYVFDRSSYDEPTLDQDEDDTHSSGLLRVLREAQFKKRSVPDSCKDVLKSNESKYRFNSCN